eukprot:TRINITY_DN8266_c0_g1_i2.p1 TRINITY_DN8266_c0_g1~~TRINITY_DN8266_c0_g1_i2.p1  ORF type:complete len:139 (-),score=34.99 TRINITY_DN8266_c0_g1_i2:36-452(-)
MRATFGLQNTVLNAPKEEKTKEVEELDRFVYSTVRGEQAHILFGHGPRDSDFEKREYKTNYQLSFNEKVGTTKFLDSKFKTDTVRTKAGLDVLAENPHYRDIPALGTKTEPQPVRRFKHYDEFTKTFDANYTKIPFRK